MNDRVVEAEYDLGFWEAMHDPCLRVLDGTTDQISFSLDRPDGALLKTDQVTSEQTDQMVMLVTAQL